MEDREVLKKKKKGEEAKKKDRRCRTCGEKVQGHVGPCGRRCRNKDLMTFDDEPEKDVESGEEVGEEDENALKKTRATESGKTEMRADQTKQKEATEDTKGARHLHQSQVEMSVYQP